MKPVTAGERYDSYEQSAALHILASAGKAKSGASVSVTIIFWEQVRLMLSLMSVARQVIVVVPTGYGASRDNPSSLDPLKFFIVQLSVAVGAATANEYEQIPGSA